MQKKYLRLFLCSVLGIMLCSATSMAMDHTKKSQTVNSESDMSVPKKEPSQRNTVESRTIPAAETNAEMNSETVQNSHVLEKTIKIPDTYMINDFPLILQLPELPTGCEVTALTMELNYYGYPVEKTELAGEYLPKMDMEIYYENDVAYGNDLNQYFIGDPFSVNGYVCGIPALITATDAYLQDNGSSLRGRDISGASTEELYGLVSEGKPVVVLVTISMEDRRETQGWYTENGDYVEWSSNDHGAVLIGYTNDTVTIADPISGIVEYSKAQFESVYQSRGQKSMIIE